MMACMQVSEAILGYELTPSTLHRGSKTPSPAWDLFSWDGQVFLTLFGHSLYAHPQGPAYWGPLQVKI